MIAINISRMICGGPWTRSIRVGGFAGDLLVFTLTQKILKKNFHRSAQQNVCGYEVTV